MTDIEDLKSPKYDEKHVEIYEKIILSLIEFKNKRLTDTNQKKFKKEFNNKINTFLKKHKITGSKIILVKAYNNMIKQGKIKNDVNFMQYLSKRPQRTASGVNSFAILLAYLSTHLFALRSNYRSFNMKTMHFVSYFFYIAKTKF